MGVGGRQRRWRLVKVRVPTVRSVGCPRSCRVDERFKLGLIPASPPLRGGSSLECRVAGPDALQGGRREGGPPKAILGAVGLPLKGKTMHKPLQGLLWSETKNGLGPLNCSFSNGSFHVT